MPRLPNSFNIRFALIGNYILCSIIVFLIFATDWWFSGETKQAGFLDGILVGVFITHCLGWIGTSNGFYFPSGKNDVDESENKS